AVVDHEGAREALARIGLQPARDVRAVPVPGGTRVSWTASTSPGPVDYRVLRVLDGGATRPVGVTGGTELEEGATGATAYIVIARRAGVLAPQARSDRADPEPPVLDTPVPVPGVSLPDVPVPGAPVPDGPVSGAPQPAAPAPVGDLSVVPFGRRIRLVYPVPSGGRAEVRRLLPGLVPPAPGTRPGNPDELGPVVPAMGPGLAIDRRPPAGVTEYVVLGEGVCGPSAAFVDLPAVTDLRREDGRLRWTWPSACTEVLLALRSDAPPASATDPGASTRKVTNTRYEIDGGVDVPAEGHAAVFTCVRIGGRLRVATEASATARIALT
nr:hypothetical protein [Geodermatophilaceae bacterium]